jgi:restriction system protein
MIGFFIVIALLGCVVYVSFSTEQSSLETSVNKEIEEALSGIERKINNISLPTIFEQSQYELDWLTRKIPSNAVSVEQIKELLSIESLSGPYGLNLINPIDIKSLPVLPPNLLNLEGDYYANRIEKTQVKIKEIHSNAMADLERLDKLKEAYDLNQKYAIEEIVRLTLIKHAMPKIFQRNMDIFYEPNSKIVLVELEIPDLFSMSVVKLREKRTGDEWIQLSGRDQIKLKQEALYSLCIRAGYLAARSDTDNNIDIITINAKQSWFDPATGSPKEGIVASLQSSKNDFLSLQIDHIEPKACFRYLKGISTPSIENITAINPIFTLDLSDRRIVEGRNISESLDPDANLAEMPWDDFEHLVRQLFEWEFGSKGVEVKVTQASRDRGVDAIMFDPDPLKGGKYVLQAKRYTRTVDVAAVRDLYGTVLNEGANRGILVTTSSYGPDTYEFAKGKPISLVDGQHLVQMLTRHGKNYHIKYEK